MHTSSSPANDPPVLASRAVAPCKRGHIGRRYPSGGCIQCARNPERKKYLRTCGKQRYAANRAHIQAANAAYVRRYPAGTLLRRARRNAELSGREFSITQVDIVIPATCPILGIPITTAGGKGCAPSLDRIDNTKGYVPGNVQVISWRANELKRTASLQELVLLGVWAAKQL